MSEYPLGRELGDYQQFIAEVTKIAAFAVDYAGGNRKYPSLHLDALTGADLATLTNAIEQPTEPRPADTGGCG